MKLRILKVDKKLNIPGFGNHKKYTQIMDNRTRHIQILDTTLRDGEQTQGVSFSPAEKTNIAKALLGKLGVDRIEVASARVSEGEKQGVKGIIDWATSQGIHEKVEVLGFVDHNLSVDWIMDTGGCVLNLLTKGSEKHCHQQLKKTLTEHIADIKGTIEYAFSKGLKTNVYLEDWSNGYADSPDYVFELVKALEELPISHIMLPDTLGVMSPDEVFVALSDMTQRFPKMSFDFHPHNDYGLATANSIAAVKAGINTIHCTINCLGERAGNASLGEVTVALKDKLGMKLSIDESHIVPLSNMVETFSGKRVSNNAPIIGEDVFTQTSGIHADGDKKGGLYQSTLKPERFQRTHSYALGKMSGKASLIKNMENLDLKLSEENQKKVLQRIVQLGDSKQSISMDDLPFIIADVLESKDYNHIKLLNCSITSGMDLDSTASIRVKIDGEKYNASGIGNGGYDAFSSAIGKILKQRNIETPNLKDFEVRIPRGGKTSALTECIITWSDDKNTFTTRGVHSNQVFAAVNATLRMINIQLQHQSS